MTRKGARVLMLALLAACVQFPQTPQETREYIRTSTMGKVQRFEVRRPYREVSRTFQARATDVLADATPASANSTKVEIYSASRRFDIVVKAITGWAEGGNPDCPDMTAM